MYVGRYVPILVLSALVLPGTGCLQETDVQSDASSYSPGNNPVVVFSNPPPLYTSQTDFDFFISLPTGADFYEYKWGGGGIDCEMLSGYSIQFSVATAIPLHMLTAGEYKVCLRGYNSSYETYQINPTQYLFTVDDQGPSGTLDKVAGQADPTNDANIEFHLVFNEPIQIGSFTATDIFNSGTAIVTSWTVSTSDNQLFSLRPTGVLSNGTVIPNLSAADATDRAGNPLGTINIIDNIVVYDTVIFPGLSVGPPEGTYVNGVALNISGDCETGGTLNISGAFDSSPLTAVPCVSNFYSEVVNLNGGDGSKVITVIYTDPAGNSDSLSRTITLDMAFPKVSSVTSPNENGTYSNGQTILIHVKFDETVLVDTMGGDPSLLLNTGQIVMFTGMATADTMEFSYTVGPSDFTSDLDYDSTSSLQLNGAIIKDPANNPANLTLSVPGSTGSLSMNKNIVIGGNAYPSGHLAFVTSQIFTGDFGGHAGGNSICQNAALTAGLPNHSSFVAIISTYTSTNASSLMSSGSGPIVLLDGTTVATTFGNLFGTGSNIMNRINIDENFISHFGSGDVWTGTNPNGSANNFDCLNWTSTSDSGRTGSTNGALNQVISSGSGAVCSAPKNLYCISTVFNP